MVRRMFLLARSVSLALLPLILTFSRSVQAEALPHAATYQLGKPLHPVALRFEGASELTIVAAGKQRKVPIRGASEIAIEVVRPAADAAVAIVRIRAEDGAWLGILGGRSGGELLLLERAEPTGDPGERRTRELTIGGEPATVRTGVRREGVTLCKERPYLFDAQQLDPASLTLVSTAPATANVAMAEAKVAPLASAGAPPRFLGLIATASSELDPPTKLPRVPRVLLDGDPKRGFALRPGGVATLRWEGGLLPIERIEIDAGPSPKPSELWWFGDGDQPLRTTIPAHPTASTFELTPPAPLAGRCLALMSAVQGAASPLEIRELRAYTELDRGAAGLERLVGLLVQDGAQGADAADLLARVGPEAAESIAARWEELPARGRRRSLKVLALALDRATVRARLVELAHDSDREQREAAVALLARGGEHGRVALHELALSADAAGDAAVGALAAHPEELPTLLAALARDDGPPRAALRGALRSAARRDRTRFRAATDAWRSDAPPIGALAALAQAVADVDGELALTIAREHAERAQTFEDRHRLALALAAAKAGAEDAQKAEAWLASQTEAAEWMQRRAALDALVARGAKELAVVAEKLARDPYPRVRAAALAPLAASGQRALVEPLLQADPWPLVRVEAARALGHDATARSALERALEDGSPLVRRAAIEALALQAQPTSWPRIEQRLRAPSEAVLVREAAILYARELCVTPARDALLATARVLLAANASEDDMRLAMEALRALRALGGGSAEAAAQLVQQANTPQLTALWQRLPAPHCEVPHQS
jgi:HEAT repeat protein